MTSDTIALLDKLEHARNAANAHPVNKAMFYLREWDDRPECKPLLDAVKGQIRIALNTKDWRGVSAVLAGLF